MVNGTIRLVTEMTASACSTLFDCFVLFVDDCDVQLLVDATWKDLDVIISSKTSPALLDSVRRIRDFIKQQQANSRRAFGGFMPGNRRTASPHTQPSPLAKPNEDGGAAGRY